MSDARFKAENGILVRGTSGSANSYIEHNLGLGANLTVSGNLISVAGDLVISGNIVYTATQIQSTDFLPSSPSGINLGNSSYRFDGYFRNINVSNTLVPATASGVTLGQPGARWDTYSTNVNANGALSVAGVAALTNTLAVTGNSTFSNSVTIVGRITTSNTANIAGTLTVGGAVNVASNVTSKGIILDNATIFSNTKTVTDTSKTTIDSFANSSSNFSKVLIAVKDATYYHAVEMLIIHTGSNVFYTQYGEIFNARIGTFDAEYNGSNVDIYFTALSSGTYTVKTIRQNILA